jgi:ABC-type glycerol-3-phosphate transport system substrate-binding protein
MKKLSVVFCLVLIFAVAPMSVYGQLKVWLFTDEVYEMINKYFKPSHKNVTVQINMITTEEFPGRLDAVFASGQSVPDVVALESAFVRKYVESGQLLDITDIYEANKSKLLAYPVEIGTYNGRVYALSWQACPGAMFYRRSLAKKYLGTDDPKAVQTYFNTINKFLETASFLKEKSGGLCTVISGNGELYNPFMSARLSPWIVDGELVIDPMIDVYLNVAKTLNDNGLQAGVVQWSDNWFAGMRGGAKNWEGKPVEIFSYFLPTWGLHYVLKTNAPNTRGDWAMIPGPAPYRWGGTWLGVYKGTNNADAAKELIRYLTTDDTFLEKYAKDSGDLVSNIVVVNKIKKNYKEPFLKNQNHYAEFADMAQNVNGKLIQGTDQVIEDIFQKTVMPYTWGEKSKEQAIADFRAQVKAQLGF